MASRTKSHLERTGTVCHATASMSASKTNARCMYSTYCAMPYEKYSAATSAWTSAAITSPIVTQLFLIRYTRTATMRNTFERIASAV
ncbi:hypothetical protein FQZ97_1250650 [compost metagenome]